MIKLYTDILGVDVENEDGMKYSYEYNNPVNTLTINQWVDELGDSFVILLAVGNTNLQTILTTIDSSVTSHNDKIVLLENEDFNYFDDSIILTVPTIGLDIVTVYDQSFPTTEIYDLTLSATGVNNVKIVKLYIYY